MFLSIDTILGQVLLHAPGLWPFAAAAAGALLMALLLLYPPQLMAVRWSWRILLPLLRLVAMLALSVSLLKPVVMRLATTAERGAVVILVDRSKSMAVVDNARAPAQLVALADALGKLPAGVRGETATALGAGLERLRTVAADVRSAQEDLDYARVSGRDIQFRQQRLKEAASQYAQAAGLLSAKTAALTDADDLVRQVADLTHPPQSTLRDAWRTKVPEQIAQCAGAVVRFQTESDARLYEVNAEVRTACDAVAALSRFALVEQVLLRPGGIVSEARKEVAVEGFGLAADVTHLILTQGDHPVGRLDTNPDGDGSDITAGIARATAGRAVRAVVLFSDGRQVGGNPTIVSGLTPNGVPVFTVSAAAVDPPRDLSFASVTVPQSVFAGQSIAVKVELHRDGFDGQTVELHCQIGEEKEQIRKIVLHEGKRAEAEFSARLAKAGVQRVRLWFPKVKGEASADNNQADRWVKVVPERMKVLLLAGAPAWDFQYVRNALSRLPEVQLKDAVLDPNNPHFFIPPREILSQDVIVLFDVPVAAFDEKHWDAVERVAQVAGGSVILVAGESHLPAEYDKFIPTSTLLPFRASLKPAWSVWPLEDPGFHFVPAPDAESLEMLRLPSETDAAEGEAPPRRWEQLPGCYRFLQLPEIRDEKTWKPQTRALLVEEESRLPVLTEMRLGAGTAFFLGINETWRWRLKVGERDQEHFWRQLIQHASEIPYFAHDGPLALDIDKVSAEPGETLHIRARIAEELPDAQTTFSAEVLREGKVISEQPLSPTGPAGSGRFGASLALTSGDYEIRWAVASHKVVHTVKIPVHVAATSEAELVDLSGDPRMLRKLAEASGGEFLTLEQVNRLPERLAAAGDARSRFAQLSLWDSPYLFLLVVGCLGVEWALRKRVGLA